MRCGVRLGLWLVVCACGAALAAELARERDPRFCGPAHDYFRLANISADEPPHLGQEGGGGGGGGAVCGGACCSARREAALHARVRRDFTALAAHTSRALHGLLAATTNTLHNHVMELSKQSQNKTHVLFAQVYKEMATHAHSSIDELYADIREYIQSNGSEVAAAARAVSSPAHAAASAPAPPDADVERVTHRFFRSIFPLVYHKAAKQDWQGRAFTADYGACLAEAYAEIEPFGEIPRRIAAALTRGLRATRELLDALALASDVLAATDALLAEEWGGGGGGGGECRAALLRMSYCGKCRGLPPQAKPCAAYCLNVVRGCVTWRVAELDAPWNAFVEGVQRLLGAERGADGRVATGDAALRPLDSRISEAIVHAMENGLSLDKKVRNACGHARLEVPATAGVGGAARGARAGGSGAARRDLLREPPLDTQITHFLASIDKSKGFYASLADALCRDESFAERDAAELCWNGDHVGEYTKKVVGAGASFQKYNPEVALAAADAAAEPRVAALADKLRHVRQVLVAQAARASPSAESFSYMQGDEAGGGGGAGGGADGSGSGPDDYAAGDDDTYDGEGSGEGSGAIESSDPNQGTRMRPPEPPASGAPPPPTAALASAAVTAAAAAAALAMPLLRRTCT